MKLCKRTGIFSALLLLLAATIVLPATAVAPIHNASNEYLASPYHAQLQSVTLTGDQRTDVVLVALSQLGYHEGNSDADMGGGSSGTRNFVEYNRLYGKLDNNEGNGVSYGYNWCCAFVTWCVRQANVSTSVVRTEVSCDRLVNWLRENSTYHTSGDGYTPETGDLIFFKTAGANRQWASHIGIVRYCDGNKVYTVEGNTATHNVALKEYSLTDSYVVGYGVPAYTSRPSVAIDFSENTTGTYFITVTSSDLNVRSGPGISYSIIGSVGYADKVTVSEISSNGWGKITVDGQEGWISLGYAQYVPSAKYTIYYDSNGGSTTVPTQPKADGVAATLTSETPIREGYTFVGWATKKNATAAEYRSGDSFNIDEDTTLYAVWTEGGEYTVKFVDGENTLQSGAYPSGVIVTQPATPTKPADNTYTYTFAGWDTNGDGKVDVLPDGKVTAAGDLVCRAVYEQTYIDYTVKFIGRDGKAIAEKTYHYGDAVVIPDVPTVIDGKYKYTFAGWSAAVVATVTENAEYTATYNEELARYKVSFVGDDGKLIAEKEYLYGDTVVVPAETPTKAADETYTYAFSGWSPAVASVTGDAIYAAQFDSTYIDYTVKFIDGDGKTVETATYHYGDTPTLNYEGIIAKTSDKMYDYTFKGWDKNFTAVTGDTEYTAQFDGVLRVYTVTFFNEDGTVCKTSEYNYGDSVELPANPEKDGYEFVGWTPVVTPVEGNTTYTATFRAADVTTAPTDPGVPGDDTPGMSTGLIVSLVAVVLLAAAFIAFIIIRKKRIG